jgi:DNA replication protein DnaC
MNRKVTGLWDEAGHTAAIGRSERAPDRGQEERQLARLGSQLAKLDLLVLDELGYLPASKVGAELLFNGIRTPYVRSSVIVTTKLPFEEWKEVLGSERLTGATLDRLTHRGTTVETGWESDRLREARTRRRSGVAN